jgi:hypothetical protein
MEATESQVPKIILDQLDALLSRDGFKQSIAGLFVKKLDDDWRAWIGVTGFPVSLFPVVGVYNQDLLNIAGAAREKIGSPSLQPSDTGPPLIMANLEQVIGDDPDCKARLSWNFEVQDHHIADPSSVPELKAEVADDLVYCLRKKAYPFFSNHMTFQSIWDAIRERDAMPSPALRNYFPIILMKLGRRDDVPRFVQEQIRQISNERVAADFRNYVDALLTVVPA